MKFALSLVIAVSIGSPLSAVPADNGPVIALDGSGATSLPRGSVVMVWATWCVPCRKELSTFRALAPAARPLIAVTLALDPPAKAAAALAETGNALKNGYATAADPQTVLTHFGGQPARLPLLFALDSQGQVCGVRHGLLGSDQLKAWAVGCRH